MIARVPERIVSHAAINFLLRRDANIHLNDNAFTSGRFLGEIVEQFNDHCFVSLRREGFADERAKAASARG